MGYWNDCIISNEGDLIALSLVESIREGSENTGDQIVDKLKGDAVLIVNTAGGRQYTVSMLDTQHRMPDKFADEDVFEMARGVVRRWQLIHSARGSQ